MIWILVWFSLAGGAYEHKGQCKASEINYIVFISSTDAYTVKAMIGNSEVLPLKIESYYDQIQVGEKEKNLLPWIGRRPTNNTTEYNLGEPQ